MLLQTNEAHTAEPTGTKTRISRRTAALTLSAVFTAVIAVCSQISIPLPVGIPITLQTFAVALCGFTLPPPCALASIGVYIALGAVGAPVFSSFGGGIGVLIGKTGGFIFGFIAMTLLCALGMRLSRRPLAPVLGFVGLMLCHCAGAAQYAILSEITFAQSFLAVSVPFLIKDFASVTLAFLIALRLNKVIARRMPL